MRRRSLRIRLLANAAAATLVALGLAGTGITFLFSRHIERREAVSLTAKAQELLTTLRLDPDGRPVVAQRPSDSRYAKPASGLYWQVSAPTGSLHSRSLWDQSLPRPKQAIATEWTLRRTAGPFGHGLLILERVVRPDTTNRVVLVQFATDDEALKTARSEFEREIALSLALLWLVLVAAAYVQVMLGLYPLRRVGRELDRLLRNPAARLSSDHPQEVQPLTAAINALADARAADLDRARKRAGDLAHGLKTPLAAMAAQSHRARQAGAIQAADGLDRVIASASATLEAELARARAAAVRIAGTDKAAYIAQVVDDLVAVIERTAKGEQIVFQVDLPESFRVPVSTGDLTEMVGALLENAVKFATRRVGITGITDGLASILCIGDDGPGLPEGRSDDALIRGGRLDEAGQGHGFGLAIVHDLVAATEGTIDLGVSPLGGLAVSLRWPTGGRDIERAQTYAND